MILRQKKFFGGQTYKKQINDTIENVQIQNFGNAKDPKFRKVYCYYDGMHFTVLNWVDFKIRASKDGSAA